MRLHRAAGLAVLQPERAGGLSALNPSTTAIPATAPNPPAVAGRKNRNPDRDASPSPAVTSRPAATAAIRSRPDTPPSRSANARTAGNNVAIAWTTAPRAGSRIPDYAPVSRS